LIDCPQFRHSSTCGDVSQHYGKIEAELLAHGIAREGKVGDGRSILCETRAMADLVGRHLDRDPHYFEQG
jgi:aminoglycoside 3-N-acetyltransferase